MSFLTDVRKFPVEKMAPELGRKILFWISFWAGTWALALLAPVSPVIKVAAGLLHMLSHLFIALNIAHDANHRAITSDPFLSAVLMRTFDLIGISSYCWRKNHNEAHHHYTSIRGYDSTADGKLILRFTRTAPRYFFHRFQHLYAPVVYCLVSLNYVFARDFIDFFRYFREEKDTRKIFFRFLECLAFKVFYVTYTLVLPCLFFPQSIPVVIGVFLLGHALIGQVIILIQVPHFNERTSPVSLGDLSRDEMGNLEFILRHTKDIATGDKFWNWLLGGINHHTIHHIAPRIPHTAYPALTMKLETFCRENGKDYAAFSSVRESYVSHYRYLKHLGKNS